MSESLANKIGQVVAEYEQEWQRQVEDSQKRISELEQENADLRAKLGDKRTPWADVADEALRERLSRLGNPPLDTIIREAGVVLEHRLRTVSRLDTSKVGVNLVDAAFAPKNGVLVYSSHPGEQEGVKMLYRGAMQFIRNPPMHKLIEYPEETARLLVRLIDSLLLLLSESGSQKQDGKQWDEASFFQELKTRQGSMEAATAKRILEWAKRSMPSIWWGKGIRSGSFIPGITHKKIWHQLIGVWTYGQVELQFQYMKSKPPFDSEAKRLELLRRWNEIPSVYISEEAIARRPSIKLSELQNEEDLTSFLATLDWAVEEIQSS